MTSRDWQADRRAVFDRDDHACRHCGASGDAADPTGLRTYPVGAVPLEGTVHESALATVCTDCFETLQSASGSDTGAPAAEVPTSGDDLFELVRETTRIQGGAISEVASFASLATSLPTTLAEAASDADGDADSVADPDPDGGAEADADSGSDGGSSSGDSTDEPAADYRDARREVRLALAVVDAHLERVRAVDEARFDDDVRASLSAVAETATDLQSRLRAVVDLAETVPAGLGRCHGCFDAFEGDRCSTCGLEARGTADWRDDDEIAFERLFSSINDGLQEASATTEALTDRTMTLATGLTES